jgi:hypothetical protein
MEEQHSLLGEGVGGPRPGTLYTLVDYIYCTCSIPRVQEFLSLCQNWVTPPPPPQVSVSPPLDQRGVEQHSLAGEGGPNSDDWKEGLALSILYCVDYIHIVYMYIKYKSFSPIVGIGSTHSLPGKRVYLPPLASWGGGGATLGCEVGPYGVGGPNADEGTETLVLIL